MSEIIQFPTRMQVEMHGRSVSELRETLKGFKSSLVASQTAALEAASVKIISIGDYPEDRITKDDDQVNWEKATSEDRIYGLKATRLLSFSDGAHYKMENNCERCDKKFVKKVDLRRVEDGGDIVCWEFEYEEHRDAFKRGVPFEGKLRDRLIKWRLLYGEDEAQIERIAQNNPNANTSDLTFNMKIVEVEGMHRNDVDAWLKTLGDERIELQDMMAEASAGVDLVVDAQCPWCDCVQDATIPFDLEFWIPVVQTQRDRRRRRREKALKKTVR
ncbi:MAG: hypothetical protein GY841_15400 [FCB group bacterium]|nr:hypothetical protein [FCB group bacterium]